MCLPELRTLGNSPGERAFLDEVFRAGGMHEDQHAQFRRLGPEGVVLREREILPVHMPAD